MQAPPRNLFGRNALSPVWRKTFWLFLLALAANPVFAQRPLGVDVSDYQNTINWASVKNSGVTFAWAKATEGANSYETTFTNNMINARTVGVFIGAYHYAHPELHIGAAGAQLEAAHFWNVASSFINTNGPYMMPMLDIEQDLSSASPAYTKATLSQWVNVWCSNVVSLAAAGGVTVKPVVYTYTSYATGSSTSTAQPGLDSTVTVWPLWMASYPASPNLQTGAPSSTTPWSTWAFWQYGATGTVPGIAGSCDVDEFNGSIANLGAQVIGGLNVPYFTTQLINSRVTDLGGNVTFSATAGGIAPLYYQWRLNGVNILNATNSAITISNAQLADAGNYSLAVTNAFGRNTTGVASLTVYPVETTVFADNFDVNSAANWIVNKSSSDNSATFSFDYSTLGIPAAPNSTNGSTLGVQMKANLTLTNVAALSISPMNQNFSDDYRLHFDAWMNVNGPFPNGGAGSTEFLTAGVGTAGNRTEWTGSGSTADGFYFSADGDGGVAYTSTTTGDYSGYKGTNWQSAATGIYAASSLDNSSPYYTTAFPTGKSAPAFQQSNYAQQSGALNGGTFGFAWHDVIVSRRGNTVNWAVDGILFATISNANFTANNVFVGFWDPFASLSSNNAINFGLVDNVRVEVPAVAPLVLAQPQSQTVALGTNVSFTVAASGLPAPNFQWQFNGTNILGATNSSVAIANVTATNTGNYSVIVANVAGSTTSSNAALALQPPVAAQFQTVGVQPDGSLQISFTGTAAWNYTVETSTNLTDWSALTNLASPDGNFIFNAGSTTDSPQQFYRARVGP